MRKLYISVLAAMVFAAGAGAQDASSLYISSDPVRMGTAGISFFQASAFAADGNSAAMSLSEAKASFGASYGSWAPDASAGTIIGAGGFYRAGKLGIGLFGRKISDSEEMILTNENSVVTGTFKPSDMVIGLGVSYSLGDALSVGVSAKYLSSSLSPDDKASSVCADLGVNYVSGPLKAGAGIGNVAASTQLRAGASYEIAGLTPAVELTYNTDGGLGVSAAAQYDIAGYVSLRAGYHFASGEAMPPSFASLGLGLHFAGISLNAAYLLASDTIGGSFLAGLSYSF